MGSEMDMSVKSKVVMEVCAVNSQLPMEELGNCESNREDDVFHMEVFQGGHDNTVACGGRVGTSGDGEEVEVDVVGNMSRDEGVERLGDRESQDATECSSSFGCTDSDGGDVEVSDDVEVESHVYDENAVLAGLDGCADVFGTRKKKLSDEWRKFVHPLMWRCKWVELKVRELQYQAAKYDRELAECDKRKHCELEKISTEDHAIKSAPFINHNRSTKLMKRKKRKRVEETVDLASYTACHSLFAHFVKEKSGPDTAHVDDDSHAGKTSVGSGEFDLESELPSLQFKDSDAFESILRKIEEAQVHVRQLKLRMDKVVRENAEKFPSDCPSFASHDQSTSSDPNSAAPHVNDGRFPLGSMPTTSQRPSKRLAFPETAVSASEVTRLGMIKSVNDPSTSGKQIEDNQPVKEEPYTNAHVENKFLAEPQPEPEGKPEIDLHAGDTSRPTRKLKTAQQAPTVKTQSLSKITFPKNTRKRGRRKARSGRWSKRSSG
ncbi:hypothetical protein vseg_009232 [Gypsophila vaccaria]